MGSADWSVFPTGKSPLGLPRWGPHPHASSTSVRAFHYQGKRQGLPARQAHLPLNVQLLQSAR